MYKTVRKKLLIAAGIIGILFAFILAGYFIVKSNRKNEDTVEVCSVEKAQIGDIVEFGTLEQDNDLSNGNEPIEWIVLDEQDGRLLLISRYIIDAKPYHEEYKNITWEQSDLRLWLNEIFYEEAFTRKEREQIQKVQLSNPDNPDYGTEGGNDTIDSVFLLSVEEAEQYFSSESKRKARGTAYANERWFNPVWWWLRSSGCDNCNAAFVDYYGYVSSGGDHVDFSTGVRPALWVEAN
ncbi:MAG: DUF6273 domain-containing protein [Bacillota bacterium]|nr:DUF6273 domain-containing protein [Bacillota bacterium]